MGYRPEDQSLEEPLNILIDAMEKALPKLQKATSNRVDSGEWQESHIGELPKIWADLFNLLPHLMRIKHETW